MSSASLSKLEIFSLSRSSPASCFSSVKRKKNARSNIFQFARTRSSMSAGPALSNLWMMSSYCLGALVWVRVLSLQVKVTGRSSEGFNCLRSWRVGLSILVPSSSVTACNCIWSVGFIGFGSFSSSLRSLTSVTLTSRSADSRCGMGKALCDGSQSSSSSADWARYGSSHWVANRTVAHRCCNALGAAGGAGKRNPTKARRSDGASRAPRATRATAAALRA
mmetsp:Transcript_144473/g.402480  ORF Transcript_144473/g.402480 Transcript_144473/m.402480 type:complete len:221 (+) Transcript_144473:675-1337(+)